MENIQPYKFKRDTERTLALRLREDRQFIQVVIGPRQVGKTTAIQQVLAEADYKWHYAVADLPAPPGIEWIAKQWDIARTHATGQKKTILVIDEIQKINRWSEEVKRLWDEDSREGRNLHVVLLGSSALLIQKGLTESLAGRFEVIRFPHWSWMECRDCFGWSLDQYFYFGGYPGGASLIHDEKRWGQYVRDSLIETAISKDILLLNRIEKPVLLRQLFVLACEYGGQILSYQKFLGHLSDAGNTTTLAHYQSLIESAYLLKGLTKWSGSMIRRRSSSPKWLPLNTALMTALSGTGFEEYRSRGDLWGRLVEVSVGAYLVNEGARLGVEVYYWREKNDEVDFVLSVGRRLVAVEVKSGSTDEFSAEHGLRVFSGKYKQAQSILVGGSGVPLRNFLETPLENWLGITPKTQDR